jgi:hypothetical protein
MPDTEFVKEVVRMREEAESKKFKAIKRLTQEEIKEANYPNLTRRVDFDYSERNHDASYIDQEQNSFDNIKLLPMPKVELVSHDDKIDFEIPGRMTSAIVKKPRSIRKPSTETK